MDRSSWLLLEGRERVHRSSWLLVDGRYRVGRSSWLLLMVGSKWIGAAGCLVGADVGGKRLGKHRAEATCGYGTV